MPARSEFAPILSHRIGTREGQKGCGVRGVSSPTPPVRQLSPFENLKSSDIFKYLGSISAPNLWAELFSYGKWTVNMRHNNDQLLGEILNRARIGVVTSQDCCALSKRLLKFAAKNQNNRI
ncbi:unnamed protein product [Arctia plantaginis]|uniref:Uncharacterized protein n=1 Tax=Arctia plantaginis TaxID=874455 RepID=A0A8S0Z7C8_ARCPL|nr:unnamed protein product [Arctia plantaginis]CAB3235973.1 unnamed protein product [Arctia plantaginis]